jgi:hypothetical protein
MPAHAPRSWAAQAYPKLMHFNKFPKPDTLRFGRSRALRSYKYVPRPSRCAADNTEVQGPWKSPVISKHRKFVPGGLL